jgi:hypothetical protein
MNIRCDYSLKLKWGATSESSSTTSFIPAAASNSQTQTFHFINIPYKTKNRITKKQVPPTGALDRGPDPFVLTIVDRHLRNDLEMGIDSDQNEESMAKDLLSINTLLSDNIFDFPLSPGMDEEYSSVTSHYNVDSLHDILSVIPRSLQSLPDMLLNNGYYYENFMFFCDQTSKILVTVPEHIYFENPYQKLLPKLAVANDGILCLVLCFGICHRSVLLNQEQPTAIIEKLKKRSLMSLSRLLKENHKASESKVLAIVISLGSFDIFSGSDAGDWKRHVNYAKSILNQREINFYKIYEDFLNSNSSTFESNLFSFLFRWLTYIDVVAFLASPLISSSIVSQKPIYPITPEYNSHEKYYEFVRTSQTVIIDPLSGFDIRLLPVLDSMRQLIKESSDDAIDGRISLSIMKRALILEKCILMINEASKVERYKKSEGDKTMYSTNCIFCQTSLLILNRRVLKIERNSHSVQNICNDIRLEIENCLTPGSPADVCSVFCIFTAGVESIDPSLRQFFDTRLSQLIAMGETRVGQKALSVMYKTWSTGREWTEVATDLISSELAFI